MSQEFLAVGNNLIPVDPATGGLAAMRGWRDADSGLLLTPVAGAVTIQPGKGAGTSGFVGVVEAPIPVDAGQPYTAGATSDHFAAIGIYWVGEDGQIIGNVRGFGEGRISVVGRAPDGATGALVAVFNPAVTPTVSNGVNTYTVAAFQVIQASPPIFILDPEQYVGAIVVSHPVLAAGITDPGPLDPAVLDLSWGKQVYTSLPEVYRHLDDGSLLDYLRAAGTVADEAEDLSDQVVSGLLTDPDLIPDELLGWSAQILGLNSNGSVPLRDLITARFASPYTGTRAAIADRKSVV